MPDRRWGPSGVSNLGPGLDQATRKQLEAAVRRDEVDCRFIRAFLNEVDHAVGSYRAGRFTYEQSLPAAVREDLDRVLDAAQRLTDRVNSLGGLSRELLTEDDPNAIRQCHDHIGKVLRIVAKGQRRAQKFPTKGGRFRDFPTIILSAHIAFAIQERLYIKPTTTRGGIFEETLKTVVGSIRTETGSRRSDADPDPSVRDLMRKALKARVTRSADGVLEIDPRVE